ncbi:hypothetical protein ACP70R_016097 [Stipagrostis hirtigluma subsp. patula]
MSREKCDEKNHKREKKGRRKGERREKDRDHRKDKHNKKHKREKHRERRKNKDRDDDKFQTLEKESQKNGDHGNGRPEERGQNKAVKDIKPSDVLVTRFLCQGGHTDHNGSNTGEMLPPSTESIGASGSKEKERNNLSGMVKKSAQAIRHNHGMAQKSDSISYANKKETGRGVGSKTRLNNGKSLYVGSAETNSTRREWAGIVPNGRITPSSDAVQRAEQASSYPDISSLSGSERTDGISTKGMVQKVNRSANNFHGKMDRQLVQSNDKSVERKGKTNYHKGVRGKDRDQHLKKGKSKDKNNEKEREKYGNANEQKHEDLDTLGANESKVDDLLHLPCLGEKNLVSDNMKKRKDLDANSSLCEPSLITNKLPRISPTNLTCANGEISHHAQGTIPYSSMELVGADISEVDRHGHQNGKEGYNTGSHYLEESKILVSSPSYDINKGGLKPPHPDTKYLSQVYSIPSGDVFSKCIDQGWLFSGDHVEQKKGVSEAAESPQVWAEAQLIGSAEVVALPYIVPL